MRNAKCLASAENLNVIGRQEGRAPFSGTEVDLTRGDAMERKLAAILAGDVVGYSRLMAEDETATYKQPQHSLRRYRRRRLSSATCKAASSRGRATA